MPGKGEGAIKFSISDFRFSIVRHFSQLFGRLELQVTLRYIDGYSHYRLARWWPNGTKEIVRVGLVRPGEIIPLPWSLWKIRIEWNEEP
jgi:hypothetical protein